ncbi:MAG: hypothetical protein P8184_10700 [Calditrichia bacterium]
MKKNGAEAIRLAIGLLAGYRPCPYLTYFRQFIETQSDLKVIIGTHPIPQSYFETHRELNTWETMDWKEMLTPLLTGEETRRVYIYYVRIYLPEKM